MIYIAFILIVGKLVRYMQMHQLSGYHYKPYLNYCKRKYIDNNFIPIIALLGCFLLKDTLFDIVGFAFMFIYAFIWYIPAKKRLKWTPRICRLFTLGIIVNGLLLLLEIDLLTFALVIFVEFSLIVFDILLKPLEHLINRKYLKKASFAIDNYPNQIIAITGSYGKTSTKNILASILKTHFTTLSTPKSYNTPLGISKFINSNELTNYDYLILEYGISHPGDMAKLTKLCSPNIALITDIGYMHVDQLGGIDKILYEKMSLLNSLKPEGIAVLNYQNPLIRSYPLPKHIKAITFGFDYGLYQAKDCYSDYLNTKFSLYYKDEFISEVETKLLGKHQISNLLAAIALAHELGLTFSSIINAIYAIKPFKSRLYYYQKDNMHILDDSYNTNTLGFANACSILATMPKPLAIITPGVVESKKVSKEIAFKLTESIKDVGAYVVLVGYKETKDLALSLSKANISFDIVNSFKEGYNAIKEKGFKSLLIANDLPDIYSGGKR